MRAKLAPILAFLAIASLVACGSKDQPARGKSKNHNELSSAPAKPPAAVSPAPAVTKSNTVPAPAPHTPPGTSKSTGHPVAQIPANVPAAAETGPVAADPVVAPVEIAPELVPQDPAPVPAEAPATELRHVGVGVDAELLEGAWILLSVKRDLTHYLQDNAIPARDGSSNSLPYALPTLMLHVHKSKASFFINREHLEGARAVEFDEEANAPYAPLRVNGNEIIISQVQNGETLSKEYRFKIEDLSPEVGIMSTNAGSVLPTFKGDTLRWMRLDPGSSIFKRFRYSEKYQKHFNSLQPKILARDVLTSAHLNGSWKLAGIERDGQEYPWGSNLPNNARKDSTIVYKDPGILLHIKNGSAHFFVEDTNSEHSVQTELGFFLESSDCKLHLDSRSIHFSGIRVQGSHLLPRAEGVRFSYKSSLNHLITDSGFFGAPLPTDGLVWVKVTAEQARKEFGINQKYQKHFNIKPVDMGGFWELYELLDSGVEPKSTLYGETNSANFKFDSKIFLHFKEGRVNIYANGKATFQNYVPFEYAGNKLILGGKRHRIGQILSSGSENNSFTFMEVTPIVLAAANGIHMERYVKRADNKIPKTLETSEDFKRLNP